MTLQRVALAAIAVALVCAEFVRPTHFAVKRLSRAAGAAAGSGLDQNVLDSLPPIDEQALGSIDLLQYVAGGKARTISPNDAIPAGATVILIGWCGDPSLRATGAGAFLSVDGRTRIDVSRFLGDERPDVVRYYASPPLLRSGFRIVVPARAIGSGTHELQFGVIAKDRRGYFVLGGPIDVTVSI